MTTARRFFMISGLCIGLLIVGVVLGFCLRKPPKGAKELLGLIDSMRPKASTEGDWKAVQVQKSTAKVSDSEMPVITVLSVRPILEAEANMDSYHLSINNIRSSSELKTVIWGWKANQTLVFDWLKGVVQRGSKKDRNTDFFLSPYHGTLNWVGNNFGIAGMGGEGRTCDLIIGSAKGNKKVPWTRQSYVVGSTFYPNYRYAAAIEETKGGNAVSLVIADMDRLELAGVVQLPPKVGRYPPHILLDPSTDLLLCVDLEIAWIVCVDLRSGIDQSTKPWPPPWPHPAMGPWHGNEDVLAGRFSQQPPNGIVPPRPDNYP